MNLKLALDKLYHLFDIKKLLLEGGSVINGAFEYENLIDEISLVIAPIVADKDGLPLFHESTLKSFELAECEKINQSVWLRYCKKGE
jgi:riboflavin biosynthesis pyrimidine reductase